ncbi:SDR family oxidoreductase [Amycolatopsis magusensis]|uniref:3-oxoacyl-[acyl-carrier protein] reductase n=1 Tax=Amycolatopsis magusensis TaxID=882444 RepID=A0ABS4PZF1_9PSEU|nr:SDR family oxidoreductase [Amycolatopsis magusensis]MBP2184814.1 3-oxoacyl-[acyl-carrier protein] reductase [Amycolatopsis magusensis]
MPVAIVTGSSRGIGRAIAERLAADGARVVVNYRTDGDAAAEVVRTIEDRGGQAMAIQADVTDLPQLRRLFDAAGEVDIFVSNVGVARFGPLAEVTDEQYDFLFDTNTRSTFYALREAARRVRDHGRIVVISSAVVVTNRPGTALYAATKAAGDQLVKVAAKELGARGITVNSVLPGAVRTDALVADGPPGVIEKSIARTPLNRIAEPSDIADIVGFLASHDGRWITGQTLHAGGGQF